MFSEDLIIAKRGDLQEMNYMTCTAECLGLLRYPKERASECCAPRCTARRALGRSKLHTGLHKGNVPIPASSCLPILHAAGHTRCADSVCSTPHSEMEVATQNRGRSADCIRACYTVWQVPVAENSTLEIERQKYCDIPSDEKEKGSAG
jgi:hypothetical protein